MFNIYLLVGAIACAYAASIMAFGGSDALQSEIILLIGIYVIIISAIMNVTQIKKSAFGVVMLNAAAFVGCVYILFSALWDFKIHNMIAPSKVFSIEQADVVGYFAHFPLLIMFLLPFVGAVFLIAFAFSLKDQNGDYSANVWFFIAGIACATGSLLLGREQLVAVLLIALSMILYFIATLFVVLHNTLQNNKKYLNFSGIAFVLAIALVAFGITSQANDAGEMQQVVSVPLAFCAYLAALGGWGILIFLGLDKKIVGQGRIWFLVASVFAFIGISFGISTVMLQLTINWYMWMIVMSGTAFTLSVLLCVIFVLLASTKDYTGYFLYDRGMLGGRLLSTSGVIFILATIIVAFDGNKVAIGVILIAGWLVMALSSFSLKPRIESVP